VLIHSAFIAEGEVLREFEVVLARLHNVVLQDVRAGLHVKSLIKEAISAALSTLEAF
jgi:hypothetical protein